MRRATLPLVFKGEGVTHHDPRPKVPPMDDVIDNVVKSHGEEFAHGPKIGWVRSTSLEVVHPRSRTTTFPEMLQPVSVARALALDALR